MIVSRFARFTVATLTLGSIFLAGQCMSSRAADGPQPPWAIPQTPAQRAESEANRLSTMRPPPKLFTCTPEVGAFSRPELAEFWLMVRGAPSTAILRDRLINRFGRVDGLIFDACLDYADGNGPVKHRTVIRDIVIAPEDQAIMIPRVIVKVEVVLPVREHQRRDVVIELRSTQL